MTIRTLWIPLLVLVLSACRSVPAAAQPVDAEAHPSLAPSLSTTLPDTPVPTPKGLAPEQLNTIPPEDLIQEISYFGGAGGGGGIRCEQYKEPTMILAEKAGYLQVLGIAICQAPLEEVRLQIAVPDGTTVFDQSATPAQTDDRYLEFAFDVSVDAPTGVYTVTVSSQSWQERSSFEVVAPSEPTLYRLSDPDRLVLRAFSPHEMVRLVVYTPAENRIVPGVIQVTTMLGWKEYQVDADGRLEIPIDTEAFRNAGTSIDTLVVVGDQSGQVKIFDSIFTIPTGGVYGSSDIYCRNTPSLDISPGDYVEILKVPDSLASLNDGIFFKEGDIVQVTLGPFCEEGVMLWQFVCPIGHYNCWVAETDQGRPMLQKTVASSATILNACSQQTKLSSGKKAVVSRVADEGLNMRGEAGMDTTVVFKLKPGDRVNLIEGPVCVDGWLWWYVETRDKKNAGWVREGDQNDYWLIPWEQ